MAHDEQQPIAQPVYAQQGYVVQPGYGQQGYTAAPQQHHYQQPQYTQVVVVSQPCLNFQSLHCLGITLSLLSLLFSSILQIITLCIFIAMRRELAPKNGGRGLLIADLLCNTIITSYYLGFTIVAFILYPYLWFVWTLNLLFLIPAVGVVILLFLATRAKPEVVTYA